VVAQYYNFLRLGHAGYRAVTQACRDTARWLAERVSEVGPFELVSDGSALPVFAFRLRDGVEGYSVYDVSEAVRARGWIVPAYPMPRGLEDVHVLRVVVRNGFGRDLAHSFVADLARAVERLEDGGGRVDPGDRAGFHH
jgi:glutamate decarboxylase